jgi:hypothetical protein
MLLVGTRRSAGRCGWCSSSSPRHGGPSVAPPSTRGARRATPGQDVFGDGSPAIGCPSSSRSVLPRPGGRRAVVGLAHARQTGRATGRSDPADRGRRHHGRRVRHRRRGERPRSRSRSWWDGRDVRRVPACVEAPRTCSRLLPRRKRSWRSIDPDISTRSMRVPPPPPEGRGDAPDSRGGSPRSGSGWQDTTRVVSHTSPHRVHRTLRKE